MIVRKKFFQSDIHLILEADSECMDTFPEILNATRHFLKPELLNKLRAYLSKARFSKYELTESTMEVHNIKLDFLPLLIIILFFFLVGTKRLCQHATKQCRNSRRLTPTSRVGETIMFIPR